MGSPSSQPIVAYRIGSKAHPLLDGGGAAAADDARWNSRGRYVIYTAEHYATALLEKAAQLGVLKFPRSLAFIQIHIPEGVDIEEARPEEVPGWDSDAKTQSQEFGDRWYDERRSLILTVPSLAAPGIERNVLIHQRHPHFERVSATPPRSLRCHPKLVG